MNIGFIGLGHMGHPMVENLLKNNQVKVFDLDQAAMDISVKAGATAVGSAAEAAQDADVVITMLQTGEQVSATCLNNPGVFSEINKDALYVDCSSIAINASRDLHKEAKKISLSMLDAPVSGGVAGAEAASLTFMVGGEETVFERGKSLLAQMGKNVIHAGLAGSGQAAKICNNMLLGISMIGVCEAFTLGKKLGLDPQKFFDISSKASGQCWSMTSYCPVPGPVPASPANNDYQPGFTAKMMLKDLNLSQDAAKVAGVETTMGAKATAMYQQMVDQNSGDLDFSGIIKLMTASVVD